MLRDIIIFRLTYGYKLVAVMPCEKTCACVIKPVKFSKRDCTMHFCGRYIGIKSMGNDSRRFQTEQLQKIFLRLVHIHIVSHLLIRWLCYSSCSMVADFLFECVVQLVEHSTFNRRVVGSNPTTLTHFCYSAGNKSKDVKIIKQISKSEIIKLLSEGVIRNTKRGYVDHRGEQVGYYRTKGVARKRYIEDKYVK